MTTDSDVCVCFKWKDKVRIFPTAYAMHILHNTDETQTTARMQFLEFLNDSTPVGFNLNIHIQDIPYVTQSAFRVAFQQRSVSCLRWTSVKSMVNVNHKQGKVSLKQEFASSQKGCCVCVCVCMLHSSSGIPQCVIVNQGPSQTPTSTQTHPQIQYEYFTHAV